MSSTSHATKGDIRIATGEVGLKIGGATERGTVGTNAIHLYPGTAPAGALDDCGSIYAEGAGAATNLKVMDAAGNVTVISPHDENGEWIFKSYSPKKGKTLRVDMEKLILDLVAENQKLSKYVRYFEGNRL